MTAYCKRCMSYQRALHELFYKISFSRLIALKDDIKITNDFFRHFESVAALLDNDKSMLVISSWSDYRRPKERERVADEHWTK